MPEYKAPFPWFGGKSQVTTAVWRRFGHVQNYVEPFFGSGAMLLARAWHEEDGVTETVNDRDGMVSNFWRSVQSDPEQVAHYADWPVNENDLFARHVWLVNRKDSLQASLEADPDWYDAKIAGWWVWGINCWIGGGWCTGKGPWNIQDGQLVHLGTTGQGVKRQRVHLGDTGTGVHRQRVHLGDTGTGVHRQRVHLGDTGTGVHRQRVHLGNTGENAGAGEAGLAAWMDALAKRLRRVRVCCGDWSRVCGPNVTIKHGLTAVFLDPPYDHSLRDSQLYAEEMTCSENVREWAIANGEDPLMRIALCGYADEHAMPSTWETYSWKAHGGYGNQGNENENRHKERIWFSPHCIQPDSQEGLGGLFSDHPLVTKA